MGLPSVVKGKWSARQPAVLAASLILGFFIFSLDIPYNELALIVSVVLITCVCALISTGSEDTS
jgi:hypothetical protein